MPSILHFWSEELSVTNVLRSGLVSFHSGFTRADFMLQGSIALVNLAVALVVLKHCQAHG